MRCMLRFSEGISALDLRSGSAVGIARDGSTLTPRLDRSIASKVVMLGKSNFDCPSA